MATSGSSDFTLDAAEIVEEAFERCGLELRTGYDSRTARRSLNLLFADWANRGVHLWKVEQVTQTLAQLSTSSAIATYPAGTITATVGASTNLSVGETITGGTSETTASVITKPTSTTITITVPSGTFVLGTVIRRDSTDQIISPIGRAEYLHIPNKTSQGRASQYFFDRQIAPTITIWEVPENSTDQLIYNRFIRIQDIDTAVDTSDIPFRFLPCLVSGLAYYLAMKRAPQLLPVLKAVYDEDLIIALTEDREKVAYSAVPSGSYLRVS
jgi:hypothetical protein